MPDALLTLLRWCLLALIYLFFFRVLQATWYGAFAPTRAGDGAMRTKRRRGKLTAGVPGTSPTAPDERPAPSRLVVIEPADQAGTTHVVSGEVTIGRAAGCQITLDDTYISQVHSRLSSTESGLVVEDLGSTNGTYLNRQRVTAPVVVAVGDRVQVGGTIMELQ